MSLKYKTIDACYQDVISQLTRQGNIEDISKKLLSQTQNAERVLLVGEIIQDLDAYPNVLEVRKSDSVSVYYRNLGNKCFQSSDDYRAWQYYNLSLLHAPIESENYCLALANRSAVFFSLKKFEECLTDIEEILSLKYPDKLQEKLIKRQSACEEALQNDENNSNIEYVEAIEDIVSLEGPTDSRYVCASTKLEVVFNKEMGRHVIAKEDIKVGEVLVQEEPYFTLLLKSQILFSCSYCLSRDLNLMPCFSCCFTLYCSEECKAKAFEEYHAVECPLMATLIELDFTKLELLALRTVIKACTEYKSWSDLLDTVEEAEKNINTELHGCTLIDGEWIYDSQHYASIHTLATNIEKRSVSDIFQKAVTAAVFLNFVVDRTDVMIAPKGVNRHEICRFLAGTFLLHMMTSPTNMHGLSSNAPNVNGDYLDEISLASAPYAFHSLLNHSCSPNVVRFSKLGSGEMTLFALRPIKKGTQLFDNYGPHHALEDRRSRQQSLNFQYKFICLCEACVNNWPTYMELVVRPTKVPLHILQRKERLLSQEAIQKLQKADKGTALKLFKPLCELAEVLEPYAPCAELADCQESLKQCLSIFRGVVPYSCRKVVSWSALPPKCD